MDQTETRELSYFVTVAEELHFGRAAERLGIAQPPLSRAIKQLERRMGVTLLERTSRKVSLTAAGEVFLHEGRKALDAVAAATRRAQRTGTTDPRLILVMKAGGDGGLLPEILAEYASAPGSIPVDLAFGLGDRATLLRDGRADVMLLHSPPHDTSGFDTEELLVEHQVLVVPTRHRLAGRASVRLADLRGETLPRWPGGPTPHPTGPDAIGQDPTGPMVYDGGQLMQLITLGRAVAVVPESVTDRVHSGLVCIPVLDAPTTTVVLAWPERSRSLPLAAFVHAATKVAARHRAH